MWIIGTRIKVAIGMVKNDLVAIPDNVNQYCLLTMISLDENLCI